MLTYDLEQATGPLYQYIYQCLKDDIMTGGLQAGDKLPSKRTFARNHGISTITIQNAYDQLISEGYIYTVPKKGYYVAKIRGMRQVPKETNLSLNIQRQEKKVEYAVDLSDNRMSPERFPFTVWAKIGREIMSDHKSELMEPSPAGGTRALREAVAEHLKSYRAMLVDPDQIVVGAGTEYLYSLLVQLLAPRSTYCLEDPGYKKIAQVYKRCGVTCRYGRLDDQGITVDSLKRSGADIAHISPNHHFPTGITMPASRRYEVLAWANEKEGRYLMEDDYDSEFRLGGRPVPTLFSIDACEKVIYMNTFSKSLTPTIRISYMVLPVHLANRFYEELSFYSCTVSNFEQYTLAAFIKQGYFEKHINRMRLYYARQRQKIKEVLEKGAPGLPCEIRENDSGLHFLLHLKTDLTDREVVKKLAEQGVRVHALSEYYTKKQGEEHFFIINYSNLDVEKAAAAMEIIADVTGGKL